MSDHAALVRASTAASLGIPKVSASAKAMRSVRSHGAIGSLAQAGDRDAKASGLAATPQAAIAAAQTETQPTAKPVAVADVPPEQRSMQVNAASGDDFAAEPAISGVHRAPVTVLPSSTLPGPMSDIQTPALLVPAPLQFPNSSIPALLPSAASAPIAAQSVVTASPSTVNPLPAVTGARVPAPVGPLTGQDAQQAHRGDIVNGEAWLPGLTTKAAVVPIQSSSELAMLEHIRQQQQWQAQRQLAVEAQLQREQQRADGAVAEAEDLRRQLLARLRLLRGRTVQAAVVSGDEAHSRRQTIDEAHSRRQTIDEAHSRRQTMPPSMPLGGGGGRGGGIDSQNDTAVSNSGIDSAVRGWSAGERRGVRRGGGEGEAVSWLRHELESLKARVDSADGSRHRHTHSRKSESGRGAGHLAAAGVLGDAEALASMGRRLRAAEEDTESERRRRHRAEDELEEARRAMRRVHDEALLLQTRGGHPDHGRGGTGDEGSQRLLVTAKQRGDRLEAELRESERRRAEAESGLHKGDTAGSDAELDALKRALAAAEVREAELRRELEASAHSRESRPAASPGIPQDEHNAIVEELRVRAETAERSAAGRQQTIEKLQAAPAELETPADEDSILGQLQRAQKEAIQAQTQVTVLQGELSHTQETMRAMLKKHKKDLAKAKGKAAKA